MNSIKIDDIIRLINGNTCKVLNIPGTYMSNGAYEVVDVELTANGKYEPIKNAVKKEKDIEIHYSRPKWVKPNEIAYDLSLTDQTEDLSNYLEIIYDGQEIHFIPKDLKDVQLVNDNGFKTIKLIYDGHIHNTINILIGENNITNTDTNENSN